MLDRSPSNFTAIYIHTYMHIYVQLCVPHSPSIQEPRAQDHDGLTGALLELHLDRAELVVNDVHHAFNLFR